MIGTIGYIMVTIGIGLMYTHFESELKTKIANKTGREITTAVFKGSSFDNTEEPVEVLILKPKEKGISK